MENDPLPPKPPEFLQKIKWFWMYGLRYKKIIIGSIILFSLSVLFKAGYFDILIDEITNWILCLNLNEMERPLSCP